MKIIALAKPLADPEAAAAALATACHLTAAEARMRLQTGPPFLVARVGSEDAPRVLTTLTEAGLSAFEVDEPVPDAASRTSARVLEFKVDALRLVPRSGNAVELAYSDLALMLLGTRVARSSSSKATTSRSFALGAAVVTGGLKLTKTVTKTDRTESEVAEQELFVFGGDGSAISIREGSVAFGCLGPKVQPARLANFQLVVRMLREKAPQTRFDDRLLRLGRRAPVVTVPAAGGGSADGLDVWAALVERAAALDLLA